MVVVAGIAIPTKMTANNIVQVSSNFGLSSKSAGSTPSFLRYLMIKKTMKPKTRAPMTTQIQKMVMCKPKISWAMALTPGVILMSSQAEKDRGAKNNAARHRISFFKYISKKFLWALRARIIYE